MEPMIQGTEHEYTLFSHRMNPLGIDPHRLALEYIRASDLSAGGEFLKNGSRAYFDVGHLEISTCEVTTARDVVIWEKAGERIVDLARLKLERDHNVKINAYKNNTDPDGVSYGSHENYCISRELAFPDLFIRRFVPFLVSRIIYTGAGDVIEGRYVLSPCAYLTSQLVSGGNLYNTGILHTRDEPHADPSRFRRLHVIIGDALMGEIPIWVRHFATSMVLRGMEQGKFKSAPELKSPLEDMWRMVEMVDPQKWQLTLKDGSTTTPMAIQRHYMAEVEDLVTDKHEKEAFAEWEWILTKMEKGDVAALRGKIEWMNRLTEVERMIKLKGRNENVELAAVKQYSEIGEGRSLYWKNVKAGKLETLVSDAEVRKAIMSPPDNTRAKARVAILQDYEIASADWAEIRVLTEEGGAETVELPDPYSTKAPV